MTLYYKTDNCALYQCDNLKLLNSLPDNYIDLIYCDILYNTGKKFKDYNDNLGTPQDAIEWYKPRLIEMQRTLKDSGVVCLQMDYRLSHYMKICMDDIFKIENFKNEIIWCYRGGGVSKKGFANKHDVILCYAKNLSLSIYNPQFSQYSEASEKLVKDRGGKSIDGKERDLDRGCHMNDWWTDINALQTWSPERLGYDTQKPKALIQRLVDAYTKKEGILADFFMGSGVSGEVAIDSSMKFIGCDIGDNACKIAKERLEKLTQ